MKLAKTAAIAAATLLIGCSDAQEGKVNGGQIDATTTDASVGYDASPETMMGDISAPDASTTETADAPDAVESPALATRAYLAQRVYEVLVGNKTDCEDDQGQSFADVPTEHPNFEAINCLKQMGIANGHPDGSFKPDDNTNKAETAQLIYNALSELFTDVNEAKNSETQHFEDVPLEQWYAKAVNLLVDLGIIPKDESYYYPADATTEEFLEMLLERACDKGYCAN